MKQYLVFKTGFFFCLSVLFMSIGCISLAQEAVSRAVGYLVQSIPAGQSRSFSIPFDPDASSLPGASGRLTAVGPNYIENSGANWTPGAYSTSAAPYFVRITSGAEEGRTFRITSPANTSTRLYVDDDGLGLEKLSLATGDAGTTFEVIPADTLATFFGTTLLPDSLVLQGAGDPTQADLVQVWSGTAWLSFYYNTAWRRWARDTDVQGDPSRDDFFLRPDRGLMITRRGSTSLELAVIGRVLGTPQRAVHARTDNALTFLATMQPGDITLGQLRLQASDRSAGWRSSNDPSKADLLSVWSGATWLSFFYNDAAGYWQRVGDTSENRDGFVVRAGVPVFIQRRAAAQSVADRTIVFPAAVP